MGRKILISFLGTGPKNNIGKEKEAREYRPANYRFDEETEISTSFIADALVQKYKVENTILLGTTHSMWERVYEVFCNNKNKEIDLAYFFELSDYCDKANSKSNLMIPRPEIIEHLLGDDSHVVLLKYGINDEEIKENISIVLQLEKYLKDKDELIVDITHSFRSLPLYIMNLLLYLKNVSSKNIKISKICYGMLDATDEFGYTPVVSLDGIMDVQDWITGAYNFIEYGNTYKISELLKNDRSGDYSNIAETAKKFADVKNLNYIREFRSGISSLITLCNRDNLPELGKEVIAPIMEKFTNRFPKTLKQSVFQYRMAEWHYNHHNYGYALTLLIESIVTYCCEIYFAPIIQNKDELEKTINNKNTRDLIKDTLNEMEFDDKEYQDSINKVSEILRIHVDTFDEYSDYSVFMTNWNTANKDRNNIVHNTMRDRPYNNIIKDLKTNINYFKKYMGS